MELSTSKDLEKGYAEKIGLMEMEIGGLQADKQTTRNQIHRLEQRREELSKKVMDLTSTAQGAKKAVHDAKDELVAAYSKLLAGIKEKWVAKKEYTVLEGQSGRGGVELGFDRPFHNDCYQSDRGETSAVSKTG